MCSYSVGDSILSNLSRNYPVGAFVGKLSERVYCLSEKDWNELDSCTKSLRWNRDEMDLDGMGKDSKKVLEDEVNKGC